MKVIDLFCGVGGLSLGFEKAGFDVVAGVDFWEDAINTFNHNHKNNNGVVEDIKKFNTKHLPQILAKNKITGVIGGPPCQGFSSARLSDSSKKMGKINEERNHLYIDFFNTVKKASPNFFLIENVRGMVTLDKGAFVSDIYDRFGNLGYTVNHAILDSSDYGVPQARKRVFFIGIKGKKFIFPNKILKKVSTFEALSDLPKVEGSSEYLNKPKNKYQSEMRKNVSKVKNHEFTNHSEQTKDIISKVPDGGNIRSLPKEYWNIRKFNKAFQRMDSSQPSLTIDTGHRNYFHYEENRIPTVRESARIQSFSDGFEFLGSKTSQYKQVGNAVPPKLAFILAAELKKFL